MVDSFQCRSYVRRQCLLFGNHAVVLHSQTDDFATPSYIDKRSRVKVVIVKFFIHYGKESSTLEEKLKVIQRYVHGKNDGLHLRGDKDIPQSDNYKGPKTARTGSFYYHNERRGSSRDRNIEMDFERIKCEIKEIKNNEISIVIRACKVFCRLC